MFPSSDANWRNWVTRRSSHAPRAYANLHYMRLGHAICDPSISNARGAGVILFVFVGLARVFNPNPVRNLHYKF